MESKEGVFSKLRRLFSGSSKEKAPVKEAVSPVSAKPAAPAPAQPTPAKPKEATTPAKPPAPQLPPAEMVQEQARFLCSDAWLANKITVKAEVRDGKTYLSGSPPEAAPYIRAAYQAKKDKLPENVLLA
ncbi:MAG: hypothetical protein GX369_05070 [Euryarchaeota archaeon]|nr:hypothetical protein [Euryarchaeota archaeon]